MANHGNHGPGNDVIEVLDDDLLEEAELILDEGESDEFEDEATAVYDPDQHDGGFEDEATRVFDPGTDDGEFTDEATRVWQTPEPEPAPRAAAQPARPARGASPFTVQLPQAGMAEVRRPVATSAPEAFDEERTVITDSASLYGAAAGPRSTGRQQVVRPAPVAEAPRGRSPWVPALALLLVGGLAAAAILFFGRTPTPAEPTTAGPVLLATTPSGATVTLNGQPYANTTPTTLPDLELGEAYTLVLELDGYEPIQDVVVPTNELLPKEYTFEMTAASMTVRTVPAGAQIAVDGVARGVSPLTIPSLDPQAPHTVVATLEGHEPATRSVSFTAAGPREQLVSLSLVPVPPPAEASGEGSGDAALAAGDAENTEEPASEPVAQRTRTTERAAEREEEPTRTRTTERTTERTPDRTTERPTTRERPTRSPTRERPSATRERPSRTAPAEPVGFGTLSVQAVPFGQVWVDGRMVSPETPLINHRLEAGSHRIKVYYVNLRQFSDERTVRIEPDGSRTVTFRAQQ